MWRQFVHVLCFLIIPKPSNWDRVIRGFAFWTFQLSSLLRTESRSERLEIKLRLLVLCHLTVPKENTFFKPMCNFAIVTGSAAAGCHHSFRMQVLHTSPFLLWP